ncbi:MAG: collagen-like protein [Firmicutes bacterium]|nr:collagen-like protein [Bacillota bacterium]
MCFDEDDCGRNQNDRCNNDRCDNDRCETNRNDDRCEQRREHCIPLIPGPRGPMGPRGPEGCRGEKGEKGERGCDGRHGERGERGERGCDGRHGERGERGEKGEKGDGVSHSNAHICFTGCQVVECGHAIKFNKAEIEGRDICHKDSDSKVFLDQGTYYVNFFAEQIIPCDDCMARLVLVVDGCMKEELLTASAMPTTRAVLSGSRIIKVKRGSCVELVNPGKTREFKLAVMDIIKLA